MLNKYARALFGRIFTPIAKALVRAGVSPDVVTIVGTLGVMAGALILFPRGEFFWGTMAVTAFVFSDIIDGLMARMTQRSSLWGVYLDSTLDRFGDAAVFCGLAMWFAGGGDNDLLCALCLYNLAAGSIVSYARAKAESLGMWASGGIAERSDRLVVILVATGFQGVGVPGIQRAALIVLGLASTYTVFQRIMLVRYQALEFDRTGTRPVIPAPAVPPKIAEKQARRRRSAARGATGVDTSSDAGVP